MRATEKKLVLLSVALAACAVVFLALLWADRKPPETAKNGYYFTNYPSAEALQAVSVENDESSIILVQSNGTYKALSDSPVPGDEREIAQFFQRICYLPLLRMVEGAQASDGQYGLTKPQATVLIQDAAQGGTMFLLGNTVPGGEGFYACLAGDDRVFIMASSYAELFLEHTDHFLDLSLFPSLEGDGLADLMEIEIGRDGASAYRLRQAGSIGGTAYFSLEEPWHLLLGAEPVKNALLTPLRQLEGFRVLEGTPGADYGLTEESDFFRLGFRDGTFATVLVGPREGDAIPVMAEGSATALLVPAASLSFMDAEAEEIMGRVLLRLNVNDIKTLTLGPHTYEIKNSAGELRVIRDGSPWDAAVFLNTLFPALNHISIGGPCEDSAGPELLRLHISSSVAEESISLVFRRLDGRRCAVEINGQTAVWCDLAAVSALLDAAD